MSERLDPELTRLESSLRCLAPPATSLNREQLMFEAGQASAAASSKRRWQIVAVMLSTSNVLLVGLLVASPFSAMSRNPASIVADADNQIEQPANSDGLPIETAMVAGEQARGSGRIPDERTSILLNANQHSMHSILKAMSDPSHPQAQPNLARESHFAEPPPTARELLEELCPRSQFVPVRRPNKATWQTLFFNGEVL